MRKTAKIHRDLRAIRPAVKINRGRITIGETHLFNTAEGRLYVTVNLLPGTKQIIEVIPTIGKAGQISASHTQTEGKLISSLLKRGHSVESLVRMLKSIRGAEPIWDDGELIKSVPYAIGLALERVHKKLSSQH